MAIPSQTSFIGHLMNRFINLLRFDTISVVAQYADETQTLKPSLIDTNVSIFVKYRNVIKISFSSGIRVKPTSNSLGVVSLPTTIQG